LRKFNPDDFGLLICDEAHHSVASTYQNVCEHFGVLDGSSNALLLGVTATPVRSDGKSLGDVFQEIVYHMDIRKAVIDGWLVDIKGVRARTESNLDKVRVLPSGDFDQVGLSRTINNHVRNALVLKTWRASQQFAPIDQRLCRTFKGPCKTRWSLAGLLRESDRLVDSYTPIPCLLFNTRCPVVWKWRIENLADAAFGYWRNRLIGVALCFWRFARANSGTVACTVLAAGLWLRFSIAHVVDLLGAHATEPVIDENAIRKTQACVEQQWVDSVVARLVPASWIAPGAPYMML
jgi:hypothetical protein